VFFCLTRSSRENFGEKDKNGEAGRGVGAKNNILQS
jgi:hypothetical protein